MPKPCASYYYAPDRYASGMRFVAWGPATAHALRPSGGTLCTGGVRADAIPEPRSARASVDFWRDEPAHLCRECRRLSAGRPLPYRYATPA